MTRTRKLATLIVPMFAALTLTLTLTPAGARAADPAAPAAAGGVKGDILVWIEDAETKLVDLAAATPEAKYKWRPSKDARSVADVFMHVVSANYGIPSFAGAKPPEGFDFKTHEKSLTKKADIEKALKDSFAHAKKALSDTPEADFNKQVEMFGRKSSVRGVYLLVLAHAHEHLGQSIAYARSNKITPPWTAARDAKAKAAAGDKKE